MAIRERWLEPFPWSKTARLQETSLLRKLFPHTGQARIIGITGSPGSGKSSLVDRLAAAYRQESPQVGIIAVDPSSPFTGGAILGDRIRMQALSTDPGIFIQKHGHTRTSRRTGGGNRRCDSHPGRRRARIRSSWKQSASDRMKSIS